MNAHFKNMKTRPLKVSDCIVASSIPCEILICRIFLNDHLAPAAVKLDATCFKSQQDKTIIIYKIANAVKLPAVLTLPDNTFMVRDLQGCVELLKNKTSPNTNI